MLDQILKLLHPFMPFVTEELWAETGKIGPARDRLLILSDWPDLAGLEDAEADAELDWLIALVSGIRSVRQEMNVPAGAKIKLVVVGAGDETGTRVEAQLAALTRLARLETVDYVDDVPPESAQIVLGEATFALPLAGVIDIAAERARLAKDIAKEDDRDRQDRQEARQRAVRRQGPARGDRGAARSAAPRQSSAATRLAEALARLSWKGPRHGRHPGQQHAPARHDWMTIVQFDGRGGVRKLEEAEEADFVTPAKGFALISGNSRAPEFKVWLKKELGDFNADLITVPSTRSALHGDRRQGAGRAARRPPRRRARGCRPAAAEPVARKGPRHHRVRAQHRRVPRHRAVAADASRAAFARRSRGAPRRCAPPTAWSR